MKTGEKIKKIITNLQDKNCYLFCHKFDIDDEYIISDESGSKVDLKEIIFVEFYFHEMILHSKNDDKYLLAYEGITKFNV